MNKRPLSSSKPRRWAYCEEVNAGEPQILQLDISGNNLFLPTAVGNPQAIAVGLGISDRLRSFMSPTGERLIVDVPGSGLTALLLPRPGDPVQGLFA